MFRRLQPAESPRVTVTIAGKAFEAREGDTVAAAMLAAGHVAFRHSAVSGAPRGPWCLMGACFECLVTIDGVADRQACMTPVRQGMRVDLHELAGSTLRPEAVDPWGTRGE